MGFLNSRKQNGFTFFLLATLSWVDGCAAAASRKETSEGGKEEGAEFMLYDAKTFRNV